MSSELLSCTVPLINNAPPSPPLALVRNVLAVMRAGPGE